MRADDGRRDTDVSATTSAFRLLGGKYGLIAHSSNWNSATVALSVLASDDTTYVTAVTAFSADGAAVADLPPGTYKWVVTGTLTGHAYLTISRVPGE